jgi:hypothetical protein
MHFPVACPLAGCEYVEPVPLVSRKVPRHRLVLRHEISRSTVATTRVYSTDLAGEERKMAVG